MKRLLIPLLVLLSFAAIAQSPVSPQFSRKIPNDSLLKAGIPGTSLILKLPDTSWVKKYTSTYFVHGLFIGTGTFSDPFGIANGYITPAMLHSISGVPGSGTVYYGDGHWGAISASTAWGTITGTLSDQTDLQSALNAKVPTSRTLTINGVVHDLSADRSWTVAGGVAHANNGLSLSGDTVQLGGDLTQTLTKVTVKTDQHLSIGDYDNGNGLNLQRNSDSSMFAALEGGDKTGNITGSFYASTFGAVIEGDNGSVVKSIRIDPTPTTGGMSIHDSDHLGLVNAADYSTQIKLHPYALVQTNMLNARADSIISAVGGGLRHAANGLHLSGDTVKLGGNIIEYTPITIAPNTEIDIGDPVLSGNGLQIARFSDSTLTSTLIGGNKTGNIYGYLIAEGNGNTQIKAVNNSTYRGIQIDPTPSTGYIKVTDTEHKGLVGNELFPKYSGAQYAQYHGVDSIAKAKADSVKGTISSGGVTMFNTRTGVVTLLSADVTSALGFTPENVANKATSFGTINNTLYPSVQAVNTQLGNYVPLIGSVTITGEVQSSYTPLAANDLARLTDLGLVPTVLTGMGVTVTGITASIGSGTYRLNNITYTYPGGTVTISAQDGTQYRYSILYITTAGTISVTNGALVPSDPVIPDFPSNSVDVSTIYIPPTGNTITPTGGGGKTTGTVTNFSFVNTNGFTGSVANPTTKPALTLTLNTILPSVVAQTGVGTAGTDSVMVKHSGTMKAIAPGYYLPTSTASSTYALQSTTVSAGLGLLGGGSLAANRTLSADTTVLRTVANSKTLAQEQTALNLKANLASPALTGTPTAPTATVGTNTTQIATTAFVLANAGGSFTNPMTTTGDIIYSSSGSTPARLGIGSTNQILTVSGGLPSWQPQSVIGTSSATASTVMARDSNANTQINNLIENYTTTATAAGTTTLTAASAYQQYFTGTTTQTIVLPVASTLVVGMQYQIINQSTGIVTVRSSGSNTVQAMDGNSSAVFTCILTSGTSAASWSVAFYGPASTSNSGFVTTGTQSISGAKTFTTGLNLTLAQNGKTQMNVSNGSSGAAAEARISVTNNSSGNTVLGVTSSGYTPFGALVANSSYVYSDASAGLVLMSNGASVIFASGGNAEKMRLNGAGRLLVGTSTDNGTDLIQANGTIISGIDGTTQGAVKITGTSGTVSLKTQLATTTYNYNLPVTAGTAGQVQASGGGGSSPMTWVSAPIIQGTADLTAQTAAGNIITFTVGAATATFSISAYVNVTAIATDVIQGQITYTDENSTSQTVSLTNISAIGNSAYSPIIIRAKTGTVITVKTNLSTGGGTVTFDAGARITQL